MTTVAMILAFAFQDADKELLDKLNAFRKLSGVGAVSLDAGLSKACKAHADYWVKNGGDQQKEDPKLPGYSSAGTKAASISLYFHRDPVSSLDGMLSSIYFRPLLLNPALKGIGVGHASGDNREITLLDARSGVRGNVGSGPVISPGPNATGISTVYDASADPSASDGIKDLKRGGYPIMVTWRDGMKIEDVEVTVKGKDGKSIAVSTVQKSSIASAYQYAFGNTLAVIPEEALEAETKYTVEISAKVGGKRWSQAWSFTTGK